MISRRLTWIAALLTSCVCTINAEELETTETTETSQKSTIELPAWVKNIKFSGYGMLQYQGQDPEGNHSNTFNLRLARFILDGKIGDFDWRAQIQGTNVKGPGEPTVQLVDLYAEWRRFPEFKVRAGQFKRAFTYENPTHPITQGWRAYADVINNLSGFGDRTGEKSSGGRDIGIQFCSTIRWASTMVKVSTKRTRTTARISLVAYGSCLLRVCALVPSDGQVVAVPCSTR